MRVISSEDRKYSKLDRGIYDSVVGISIFDKGLKQFKTIGSGLLFKFRNQIYLSTNKHVVNNLKIFHITFNDANFIDNNKQIKIDLSNLSLVNRIYHKNNEVDICLFKFSDLLFRSIKIKIIEINNYALTVEEMKALNFYETKEVVVLGHPISISNSYGLHAIVRSGTISQISYMYSRNFNYKHFLIDAFAYPGNSGGPVVGVVKKIVNNKLIFENYIIGVLQSIVMYDNINTGLSSVIAFEHVLECLK